MKTLVQKIGAVLIVVMLLLGALPLSASAEVVSGEVTKDGRTVFSYSLDTRTGVLTMSGYAVSLDEKLDSYREYIKSIEMSEGVVGIYEGGFKNLPNLTSVTFPDSLELVGDNAFANCVNLTDIKLGSKTESAPQIYLLDGCTRLRNITVSEDNPYFSSVEGVLFNKDKTEIVMYPQGKTNTSYTIPDCVTSIGGAAFKNAVNLKEIIIPDSVHCIKESAFSNCSGITNITIPNSVSAIEHLAFSGCVGLTDIIIPDGVTKIDQGLFSGCENLKSITIPASVTKVDIWAFMNCTNITDIYYYGTETQWSQIEISEEFHETFLNATVHFSHVPPQNEVTQPSKENDENMQETIVTNDKDNKKEKTAEEDSDDKSESNSILSILIVVLLIVVIVMLAVVIILLAKKKRKVQ